MPTHPVQKTLTVMNQERKRNNLTLRVRGQPLSHGSVPGGPKVVEEVRIKIAFPTLVSYPGPEGGPDTYIARACTNYPKRT